MDKILIALLILALVIGGLFGALSLINASNAEEMYEYIDSFPTVEYENQLTPSYDELGTAYFTTDEDFRVMHLTDIHIGGGFLSKEADKKALNAVAAMISAEKPDLVIVTGDISFAIPDAGNFDNSISHSFFIRLLEKLGVYYTVTFGNHDTEGYNYYNRGQVADMYADDSLKYSLFDKNDYHEIDGVGNHVINIKNTAGEVNKSLIMLDSHSYMPWDIFGLLWDYESIKPRQISWYRSVIETYQPKSSLLFFHIPIKEVKYAYDEFVENGRQDTEDVKWLAGNDGEEKEVVYCPDADEELFETVLELGNTKGFFFGHDHFNNFVMKYKGVLFSYGYSIDYVAYGDIGEKGFQRGCTMITLTPDGEFNETNIAHKNYYTENYPSTYPKEEVDMYPYFDKE